MANWRVTYKTDGREGVGKVVTQTEAKSALKVKEEVVTGQGDVFVPVDRIVCIEKRD